MKKTKMKTTDKMFHCRRCKFETTDLGELRSHSRTEHKKRGRKKKAREKIVPLEVTEGPVEEVILVCVGDGSHQAFRLTETGVIPIKIAYVIEV